MKIKTRLTEKDFINASFVLMYNKPSTIIITFCGFLFLLVTIVTLVINDGHSDISQIIAPVCILSGLPAITYFTAKRNYSSNQQISECTEYIFDKNFIYIIGESHSSQLSWNNISRVTQTKNWVFIWHNATKANLISKRDLWKEPAAQLKKYLDTHGIQHQLA